MTRDKFIFPRIVRNMIKPLPTQEFLDMIDAICAYEFENIMPAFTGALQELFDRCRIELDKWNKPKGRTK